MLFLRAFFLSVTALLILCACEVAPSETPSPQPAPVIAPADVKPAGTRQLGLAPIPAIKAGEGFEAIFPTLNAMGAHYIEASFQWDEVELKPGAYTYATDDAKNLNTFLPQAGWHVSLAINGIDTNNDRRPKWLRDKAWDDPEVVDAYWAFLQDVVAQFPDADVDGISVGNEVDIYLALNADEHSAYARFIDAILARLKAEYPTFRNGTKTTVAGVTRRDPTLVKRLNRNTDVVMTTYYAIDERFQSVPPSDAAAELDRYMSAFPGREVHFIELGAMSSERCGTSNAQQAAFVRETFAFWDRHADQVGLINYLWMSDLPDKTVDDFTTYYGVPDPCFREYLATLGFRDQQGRDKGALATLQAEATARGFAK